MARPRLSLEIFLVALAVILLEINYTRVFSYKLVYFFTYVVIGLALLGLGSGGVLVSLLGPMRNERTLRFIAVLSATGALAVVVAYGVVALVQVDAFDMIRGAQGVSTTLGEAADLLLVSAALFVPFLCGGFVIALIFVTDPERVGRLYGADLLGAALGCGVSIWLMQALSPPGAIVLAGACLALSGVRAARASSLPGALALVALGAGLGLVAIFGHTRLPDPIVDSAKTMAPSQHPDVLFSRWSPVFRIDVLSPSGLVRGNHMLAHDGMWGSVLPRFDGDPASLAVYDRDSRALPFELLGPEPDVTIIGAAGGNEILASLHFGASHVTAVELNPVTVSLLTDHFADYTGRVAEDERVRLVNAEGRAFFERSDAKTDLVWFVAPDSYAAMNAATAGAYVLSESYLYTTQMIQAALAHLAPGGIICAQFGEIDYEGKAHRTTRYLTTARAALEQQGVVDFGRHVLLATSPVNQRTSSTILLRREPFTPEEAGRLAARATTVGAQLRYGGQPVAPRHPTLLAITLGGDELGRWLDGLRYDLSPVTDDAPFFWHFVPFGAALGRDALAREVFSPEDGIGERLLVVLLVLVTGFAALGLLAPLALQRRVFRALPHKVAAGVYFAGLGLGFMFFEVTLIQRLTLFLGYPTYSLSVTLFALLVSTGLGSFASERLGAIRPRNVLALGAALVVLTGFYLFGLGPVLAAFGSFGLAARIAVACVVLAPLGLCLGTLMPIGLRTVARLSPHPTSYVAWSWAINGFFSVIASVLATALSMTFGFRAVMTFALAVYGVALLALRSLGTRTPA